MVTREELKELLNVFQYYVIGGLAMGVAMATIAVHGGIVLTRTTFGIFTTPREMTGVIVLFLGVLASVMVYMVLLPAELRVIRKKLKPEILRRRWAGKK